MDRVRARLEALLEQQRSHVAGGGCESYGDYRYHVGYIEAVTSALRLVEDESRALREDSDIH